MDPIDLGNGYTLRELREDDVEPMFATTSAEQERLLPWMPWAHDLSLDSTTAYHALVLPQLAAGEALPGVIEHGGRIAGAAAINRINAEERSGPIGYWLAEAHVGHGVMTSAVRALLDQAFGTFALHRVEIRAAPSNARSRAIPERLGFTQEGVLREVEKFPDRFGDLVVYSLLEQEWDRSLSVA